MNALRDPVTVQIERTDLPLLAAALTRFGNAHTAAAEQGAREVEANRKPGEDVRPAATRIMQLLAVAGTLRSYGQQLADLAGGIPLPAAHRHLQVAPEPVDPPAAPEPGATPLFLETEAAMAGAPAAPAPPRPPIPPDQLSAEQRTQQTLAELAAARATGVALQPSTAGDNDGLG